MNLKGFLSGALEAAGTLLKGKAPTILTGTGLVAGVATVALVAKKAPEAKEKKDEVLKKAAEENYSKGKTVWEVTKAVVPVYKEPIATGVVAAGCIIASDVVVNKRLTEKTKDLATVTAGYLALQDRFDKYKETAKEVLGGEKKKDLDRKAYEKMSENAENTPENAYDSKKDFPGLPQLYYDAKGNRFVRATNDGLREVENKINMLVYSEYLDGSIEDLIGPNDFYDMMGWEQIPLAEPWIFPSKLCFSCGEKGIGMCISKTSIVAPNGEAALVLDFTNVRPRYSDPYDYS